MADAVRRIHAWWWLACVACVCFSTAAAALPVPDRSALQARLSAAPQQITVVEPHLSTPSRPVSVTYRGWPAEVVLDSLLGTGWRARDVEVEFRALDGYVSRIPSERFIEERAFLVFERVGQAQFSVDNLSQNEKAVPLGPYYLVWSNLNRPALIAEGGTYWPYQVSQILLSTARREALLPQGLPASLAPHVADVQKHCLTCHQVNQYGGAKWPGNLAEQARRYDRASFVRWIIEPSQVKPATTMPGLPQGMPLARREALAGAIYEYLSQVPLLAPSTR